MDQPTFDKIYWLSKDPRLEALLNIDPILGSSDPYSARRTAAQPLAMAGLLVDMQIMVWGWSPFLVMTDRTQFGVNTTSIGGVGVIKTSLDPSDYPPFAPAPPPPPPPSTDYVGIDEGGGYFAVAPAGQAAFRAGMIFDGNPYGLDPRGVFIFHASQTPFGWALWFTASTAA